MSRVGPVLLTVDFEGADRGRPLRNSPLARQTDELLSMFDRLGAKATFFVVGAAAQSHPALVRRIAAEGHEIGLHSFGHIPLDELDPEGFRADTQRGLDVVQQILGAPVRGYRAPFFSITPTTAWAWDVLGDLGFAYDSSVVPVHSPVYGFPTLDTSPFQLHNGLWELPLPVVRRRGVGLPVGGGTYLRLLPGWLLRRALQRRTARGEPFCVYMHPYDFDLSTGYQRVFPGNPLFNALLLVGRRGSRAKLMGLVQGRATERMGDLVDRLNA